MRSQSSAWRASIHGPRLRGRKENHRGLGGEIQNPDHERGAKPHSRAKGAKGEELRWGDLFSRSAQRHFREILPGRGIRGARNGRHRCALQQGPGAFRRTSLRPYQTKFPRIQGGGRDLYARLRLADASHHSDPGAGFTGAGGPSPAKRPFLALHASSHKACPGKVDAGFPKRTCVHIQTASRLRHRRGIHP